MVENPTEVRAIKSCEEKKSLKKNSPKCTFGVGCARPTMACLSGVVATALISRLWGSSCVTVVKKGGPGREDPGKWVDDPFTSLWPRKYRATCLRMVDVRGPLSCWTAAKRDSRDTEWRNDLCRSESLIYLICLLLPPQWLQLPVYFIKLNCS